MAGRLSLWRSVRGAGEPWQRRTAALLLVLAVIAVHGCVADQLAERMADLGAEAAMPARIEVAYVREMDMTAPPAVAPAPMAAPPVRKPKGARPAKPPASAASAVVMAEAPPEPVPEAPPPEPAPPSPAPAEAPEPPASAAVATAASAPSAAASAPAFAWPASTRLSYVLTGNFRGEIHGSAQVEWVRIGSRYQVHLDVTVGLGFAPLLTRRMTSEGQLGPDGLAPERYDEDSKVAFRERRRGTIRFEPHRVVMSDGAVRERWPGMQDAASQFVQLTYLFTTRPDLLASGQVVEVPLALPRSVDRWLYDVLETETLYTGFGPVDAVHLKPRRVARPGSDLTAEIWFAPTLAYLPVRIRIRQDAETFIDLMISRKPQLALE
ncbi:MAG TPA: DUF3108 domain-containing protein [Albitalea sp.]|nr:DUF3108 domain-containing protein [Albitalea sp.]